MKLIKFCEECSGIFECYPSSNKIFCSNLCKNKRNPCFTECQQCGVSFQLEFDSQERKFCSKLCYGQWRIENEGCIDYIKIHLADGTRIGEHRYIMEQHIGRKLDYDEVVHHINHNIRDNRLENLEIMSREEHTRQHQLGLI